MTLEDLMDRIEAEFPWQRGWIWLLRKDDGNGGYFANVIHGRGAIVKRRFSAFGPTKIIALTKAYNNAMEFKKSCRGSVLE